MNIGKREQIVFVLIGGLLTIALCHIFIFKQRADEYAKVEKDYKDGMQALAGAEVIPSENFIPNFGKKTQRYNSELTSVVAELNLGVPPHYEKDELIPARVEEMVGLLKELIALRTSVRTPALSFLDDRRDNPASPLARQMGWNLQARLASSPALGVQGALWDMVMKLRDQWVLMNTIGDPIAKLEQRVAYNGYLQELGINPAEVSDYVIPLQTRQGNTYVFFNDPGRTLIPALIKAGRIRSEWATMNPLSVNRFGALMPSLRKLWAAELIWELRDKNTQLTKEELYNILEVGLPKRTALLVTSKQFRALIDVIKMAEQSQIIDIPQVNLLKIAQFEKLPPRSLDSSGTVAATPTPPPAAAAPSTTFGDAQSAAAPAAAQPDAGGQEAIGTGTGIEIYFRGNNANTIKFLFDITHAPRTYAIDDLYIFASPDGVLTTSATIEMVTQLNKLK